MATINYQWNRIEELFHAALERSAAERDSWLAAQAEYDSSIRSEASALLAALQTHEELSAQPSAAGHPASDSPEPRQPLARFGPYQTERLLGRGGMGAVYLAQRVDGQFDQTVALKVMAAHVAGGAALKRFQTERQLLASLNHPNITRLLDGGVASSGDPYLVMEYVEGRTLDRFCDEHKLAIGERLRLFLQVCEAVDYAHRNLVLHRDLKPGNILVTEPVEGQPATAKLLDFGTASLLAGGRDLTVTMTRQFTPRYASPEELRGERANTSSDIFSLGVILYELLTGAWPFGNVDSMFSEMNRALRDVAVKPPSTAVTGEAAETRAASHEQLGRLLQGDLSAIALKALENDPASRYGTVRQFADDIAAYLEGRPVLARPQTALYRAGKFLRRRWLPVAAAAVFVLSLSAATIVAVRQEGVAHAEAMKAEKVNDFLNNMLSSPTAQGFDPEKFTVAQLLESSEPLLEKSWKNDPLAKAIIQRSLGSSYTSLHRLDRGRALLESALATFRARGDDQETAETLDRLAENARASGRVEDGVKFLDDALKHLRRLGKQAPPALAFGVQGDLASLLSEYLNRRLPEAQELFDNAIAIGNRDSSISRPDLAQIMTRRAGLLMNSKPDEAEAMYLKALAVGRQENPGGVWEIVPFYHLTILHSRKQDFSGAAEFCRQGYEVWVRNLGPDNLNSLIGQTMCARYQAETGETAEAIRQIQAALPVIRKALDPDNFNLWTSTVSAARIFIRADLFAEAEPYAREALRLVDVQKLPEADTRRAESLLHLGMALNGQKKYVEAIAVLQRDAAIYRQLGSAKSLERVQAVLNEAQVNSAR